ncbi:MAG: hypothetical protein R6U13_05630 [Desulfatiglandaceae bacterium]
MNWDKTIHALDSGAVMAECGPMRLVISSFVGKVPQREMNVRAAREAFGFLARVSAVKNRLQHPLKFVPDDLTEPIAREMVRSICMIGDSQLTPMAAVAGSLAAATADFLFDRGMTRVIVNNGGDVAIRLEADQEVRVGVRDDVIRDSWSRVITLDGSRNSWGVATSGLGGRSFTLGIASAATVIASTASVADAAATAVANASFIEDPNVIRRSAEELDPDTDIPGLPVTVRVGEVKESTRRIAVKRALAFAEELIARNVVLGAFVAVKGITGAIGCFDEMLV